jgi:hypothetical protein
METVQRNNVIKSFVTKDLIKRMKIYKTIYEMTENKYFARYSVERINISKEIIFSWNNFYYPSTKKVLCFEFFNVDNELIPNNKIRQIELEIWHPTNTIKIALNSLKYLLPLSFQCFAGNMPMLMTICVKTNIFIKNVKYSLDDLEMPEMINEIIIHVPEIW